MEIQTALDLINEAMVYKPGYEITAEDYGWRLQGAILLTVSFDAPSTDREDAREGYRKMLTPLHTSFPIIVQDCTSEDDLFYKVLRVIIDLETHEAREFLRIKPSYHAPFHPHRIECMERYSRYSGQPVEHDLNYGAYAPHPVHHAPATQPNPAALLPGATPAAGHTEDLPVIAAA